MSTTETPHDKLLYTINQAAEALCVGRSTIYELINTGELPSVKIGTRRLVARSDVTSFVNNRRVVVRGPGS